GARGSGITETYGTVEERLLRLEVVVLASALVLASLVLYGSTQRRSSDRVLRGVMWIAYSLSYVVVTYAVGIIQDGPFHGQAFVLWASALLLIQASAYAAPVHSRRDVDQRKKLLLQHALQTALVLWLILNAIGANTSYRAAIWAFWSLSVLKTAAKIVEMVRSSLPDPSVKVVAEYMDVEQFLAADQLPHDPKTMKGYKYLFHGEEAIHDPDGDDELRLPQGEGGRHDRSSLPVDRSSRIQRRREGHGQGLLPGLLVVQAAEAAILRVHPGGSRLAQVAGPRPDRPPPPRHHRPRRRLPGRRGGARLPLRLLLHQEHPAGGGQDLHLHRRRHAQPDHVDGIRRHARPWLQPSSRRREEPRPLRHGGARGDHRGARGLPGAGRLLQQLAVRDDRVPLRARRPALDHAAARPPLVLETEHHAAGHNVLGAEDRPVRAPALVRPPAVERALVDNPLPGGTTAAGPEERPEKGSAYAGQASRARLAQGRRWQAHQWRRHRAEARPVAATDMGVRVSQAHRPDPGVARGHHSFRLD
uniref:DUF4220 domain-containing protein n=1 Tax=Aegilops tauschii subsp. strangulata TaxID=200361 RepID=A0A453MHS7_AEGTS